MTRAWEKGDNPIVLHARKEAARTGRDIGDILTEMLGEAKRERDTARRLDIVQAQQYLGFRNRTKRRGNKR
jgi:hypothetical protein